MCQWTLPGECQQYCVCVFFMHLVFSDACYSFINLSVRAAFIDFQPQTGKKNRLLWLNVFLFVHSDTIRVYLIHLNPIFALLSALFGALRVKHTISLP